MGHRLVFGDDHSAAADEAWEWISGHEWPGWTIEAVTARHGHDPSHPARCCPPTVAARFVTTVAAGNPADALRASGRGSDLLVIGHKGHGLRRTLHLGSVAESLVHDAPAPLVVVRGGPVTRRVLLAHDGSGHSHATERALLGLPWADQVDVLVLTVAQSMSAGQDTLRPVAARLSGTVHDVTTRVVTPPDLPLFDRPQDVILEWVRTWQADLVALGRSGLTGWEALDTPGPRRAGSTALALAGHSPCSVLLADDR